jgi:hypothetical protein
MEFLIIPPLIYVTGQENHSKMREIVTSTSSMVFPHIGAWSFPQQECIVKIDVYIAGGQWSFMIP